jgi:cytochrome c-type biogenesis protein CcmH/NrfG
VELDASSAWAHSALGSLYLKLDDSQKALFHLRQSVSLEPQNVTWLLALADGYRGLHMDPEATEVYHQVLALDPGNQWATEALRILGP